MMPGFMPEKRRNVSKCKNQCKNRRKLSVNKPINKTMPKLFVKNFLPTMQNKILAATEAIWDNPTNFLSAPDFLELIKALKSTEGKSPMDRITAGFPAKMLKDKEKLKLLPLPVKIEKHPEITGTDEDLLVFDWFPNESGTPKEAEEIVGVAYEFVEELIKALDKMPSTLQARSQKRQK